MKALRRVATNIIILAAVLFSLSSAGPALAFTDVGAGEWFAPAVDELAAQGVVQGHADGTFRPYDPVTRAQFAGMLHRVLNTDPGPAPPFADVTPGDWFYEAVSSLYQAGLIQGRTSTRFDPWSGVERQAAATLVVRALGYRLEREPQVGIQLLPDAETQPWTYGLRDRWLIAEVHRPAVGNAYRLAIVNGYEDGRFYPFFTLTRAQAAGLLHRAFYQPLAPRPELPERVEPETSYPNQQVGSQGALVRWAEERLAGMRYQPGPVDGIFDAKTKDAVIAFQKVERLGRDGVIGPNTWQHLFTAAPPTPRLSTGGDRVEVDLTRQVLFLLNQGRIVKILPVSTGTTGWLTPTGHFHIQRKLPYWRQSELGLLYKPAYFYLGYAIHGSYSVPTFPASHGCVRVPYWATDELYEQLPIGMSVDLFY